MMCGAGQVGPNVISPSQVALGAALVLVNACISVYLSLGLEVALAVATIRHAKFIPTSSVHRFINILTAGSKEGHIHCSKTRYA